MLNWIKDAIRSVRSWVIGLVLLAMLPFGFLLVANTTAEWNAALVATQEQISSRSLEIAMDLKTWATRNQRIMENLARTDAIRDLKCEPWLDEYISIEGTITSLAIIRTDGVIVCDFRGPPVLIAPKTVLERDWFKKAKAADAFTTGNAMLSSRAKQWIVPVSYPIRDQNGQTIAYLFIAHSLKALSIDVLKRIPPGAIAGVLDGGNAFLMRSQNQDEILGKKAAPENYVVESVSLIAGSKVYTGVGPDQRQMVIATSTVPETDWTTYVMFDRETFIAEQKKIIFHDISFILMAACLIIILAILLSRAIIRPVISIAKMSQAAATGNETFHVTAEGPSELRQLVANFNTLLKTRNDAQVKLERSEKRYRQLVDSVSAVVWEADALTLQLKFANDEAERLLGYSVKEWMESATFWVDHIHPDDREAALRVTQDGTRSQAPWQQVYRMIAKDGQVVWVRNFCKVVRDEDEGPVIRGITVDVTREIEAEATLKSAEDRVKLALEASGDAVWDWDIASNTFTASARWYEITGYSPADFNGDMAELAKMLHPDERRDVLEQLAPIRSGQRQRFRRRHRILCKNGQIKWVLSRGMVVAHDQAGKATRILGTYADISNFYESESRREAALKQYSDLVAAARDPIVAVGPDGLIKLCNKAAQTAFGYSEAELIGRSLDLLLPTTVHGLHKNWIGSFFSSTDVSRSMAQLRTVQGQRKDGTKLRLQVTLAKSSSPDGDIATAVIRDVTEIENLQEQLHQADKLAAIGQLTGGVAHDINNLLAVIMGSADLMLMKSSADANIATLSKRIMNAGRRGADLIRRLLVFSRKANIRPEIIDIGALLDEMIDMLGRTLGAKVKLEFRRPPFDCRICVDRSMLESSIINLAVNARDAMPDGGSLTFKLNREDQGPEAKWLSLSLTDTGLGMSEDVRGRIFEPFFTTKPAGSGTGLGLSMVYGFVQQSGGTINVESTLGRGTTFIVRFKCFEERAPETGAALTAEQSTQKVDANWKVLLIEDNDLVRETLQEQLEGIGCTVVPVATVKDAKLAITTNNSINFVVSDVDLGSGITGVDFAEWLHAQRRAIKGVIISGYLNTPLERIQRLGWQYLPKPVQIKDIRALLNS